MKNLIIALQYYEGDRAEALRLLRFIARVEHYHEPGKRTAEILLVNRQDCPAIRRDEVDELGWKFTIRTMISPVIETGHPLACNCMAQYFFAQMLLRRQAGLHSDVDAVLLLEPDCVPVAADWLDQLRREWDFAKSLMSDPWVVGCYRDQAVDRPHVNGVALWTPDLAAKVDFAVNMTGLGWDSAIAPQLPGHWFKTSLISNLFKETNIPASRIMQNPFVPVGAPPPVLIHGCKDESVWNHATKTISL